MRVDQRGRNSQGRALGKLLLQKVGRCGRAASECALLKVDRCRALPRFSATPLSRPVAPSTADRAFDFTVRNGFGAELMFEVACQVNGRGVVDGAVREAG